MKISNKKKPRSRKKQKNEKRIKKDQKWTWPQRGEQRLSDLVTSYRIVLPCLGAKVKSDFFFSVAASVLLA
jgi:hypothetical protein